MHFSRRALLGMTGAGLVLPRRLLAQDVSAERRFLFLFCPGGWDQHQVFAPLFDNSLVEMPPGAEIATANGLTYVDGPGRAGVRSFFEGYGDRTCLVHGFESRSVAHDVCLRLVLTGTSLPAADDWATLLAAGAKSDPLLPLVVVSGPSYTYRYGSSVVRVGENRQFPQLIDGSAFEYSDRGVILPQSSTETLQDAYLEQIVQHRVDAGSAGRHLVMAQKAQEAEQRLDRLKSLGGALDLGAGFDLDSTAKIVLDAFELGVARCGMVAYEGFRGLSWDSHSANDNIQSGSFDELFTVLSSLCAELDRRPGHGGGSLADEVTIVVLSEMGRYPQYNARDGREHWTMTSAMLIGAGVNGGVTVGGYDEYASGMRVDPTTGEEHADGLHMLPEHFGATLMALADIDPGDHIEDPTVLTAALAGGG